MIWLWLAGWLILMPWYYWDHRTEVLETVDDYWAKYVFTPLALLVWPIFVTYLFGAWVLEPIIAPKPKR